jgi:integrase
MCVTVLRHSDFQSLKPDDVIIEDGQFYIHKSNKKMKTAFKVEIHEPIVIWVRNESLLKKMKLTPNANKSNQLLNFYLRKIGKTMGWTNPVRIQTDVDKWETKPFYEWMTCHSGRHTAVCLWLSKRITHTAIKKATEWKGSKMIDYYADILNINTNESLNLLATI